MGPLTRDELQQLIRDVKVVADTPVSIDQVHWQPAAKLKGFARFMKELHDRSDESSTAMNAKWRTRLQVFATLFAVLAIPLFCITVLGRWNLLLSRLHTDVASVDAEKLQVPKLGVRPAQQERIVAKNQRHAALEVPEEGAAEKPVARQFAHEIAPAEAMANGIPHVGIRNHEPPEDLRKVLAIAGFDGADAWPYSMERFTRFGTRQAAEKYHAGDRFDKIEVNIASAAHQKSLPKRTFWIDGLTFRPLPQGDIENDGLVVELVMPMFVRCQLPFDEDFGSSSGSLVGMHPSEVSEFKFAFLTKNDTMQDCSATVAREVVERGGVLYLGEVANTTLNLTLMDNLRALKDLSRNAADYSIEIEISGLDFTRRLAWGYYRQDAYIGANRDCQRLWMQFSRDNTNPQPVYFPIAYGNENEAKIPFTLRANLDVLRILDNESKVIGGYRVNESVRQPSAPKIYAKEDKSRRVVFTRKMRLAEGLSISLAIAVTSPSAQPRKGGEMAAEMFIENDTSVNDFQLSKRSGVKFKRAGREFSLPPTDVTDVKGGSKAIHFDGTFSANGLLVLLKREGKLSVVVGGKELEVSEIWTRHISELVKEVDDLRVKYGYTER